MLSSKLVSRHKMNIYENISSLFLHLYTIQEKFSYKLLLVLRQTYLPKNISNFSPMICYTIANFCLVEHIHLTCFQYMDGWVGVKCGSRMKAEVDITHFYWILDSCLCLFLATNITSDELKFLCNKGLTFHDIIIIIND